MRARTLRQRLLVLTLTGCAGSLGATAAHAQATAQPAPQATAQPAPQASTARIGVQGLGVASLNFMSAKQSFEATGLNERPFEFGGGVRVTDLWRTLFVEVHATRWSSSGERTFVDSSGTSHPLGIPLDVDMKHVEVTVGWRFISPNRSSIRAAIPYFGAGAGRASYREESPFAEEGDDLDASTTTYHVAFGADFPLSRWLALAADFRYRFAPDVLGEGGVSSAFDEDDLGGFRMGVGVRVGFGGAPPVVPRRPPPLEDPRRLPESPTGAAPAGALRSGVIAADAPVYLLPDVKRVPLRVIETGTTVRIIEEIEGWVRIEFRDPLYGARVGYVESKFVRR
jgi:opacity protein-like surface antigen